eukprot:gnl/TRDRNA2_/TRDRNA2_64763_c0_seq1.p1 gnl/TRDRNA2_/TRDRNA2_64763_c0~~gnl/TRDRNA2_/TRDRNA2_64763_c0_seq1.p1  ORF type:complete len:789 (-),score=206.40 gnl/TRDRNA2_/TRDRNA2_64763_c0_seq1:292-2658(-)
MAEATGGGKQGECVKVVIRCRPMSKQELADGREEIVTMDAQGAAVVIRKPGSPDFKDFTFDGVYPPNSLQSKLYDETGYAIVESVMDGYNGTIFAYGQTGTGKTFTMVGVEGDENLRGLIPRSFEHIFRNITTSPDKRFLVRASFLEIYNEEIRDLLSKNPKTRLELKDHPDSGVFVKDLTTFIVKGVEQMKQVMETGQSNRSVASTNMNSESSRSHSIFTITIEVADTGLDGKEHIRVGKMNLVDLAGSERQSKTGASGETLKEATKINMSLSALGNVISALVDSKTSFIPYRDSKLTRLLQDSLGGNTKTVMCANIGPVDYNYDETLSTLRYAYRAKSIKNKPKINEDPKDAMIREFQDEIAKLKNKLAEQAGRGKGPGGNRGGGGGAGGAQNAEAEVVVEVEKVEVEKIVEREVVVEKVVQSGITDADIQHIQNQLDLERQQMESQLAAERSSIEQQKNLADEEKQRLLAELEARNKQRVEEEEQQESMLRKLKDMEEKMLQGTTVMEKALAQEQELKRAEIEVEERKREEERMKEDLENQSGEKLALEEKYASTEEQVQKMTTKLEKLWHRHKQTQQEIQELQKEFQQERDDMLETIRDLRKEVKLVHLTIESFAPMEHYQQIVENAHWDEASDEWVIDRVELSGNRIRPPKRRNDKRDGNSPRSLLRGPSNADGQGDHHDAEMFMNDRPNVYFVYTEDGGAQRAETRPPPSNKVHKNQRMKSAGLRPGSASRRGRTGKSNSVSRKEVSNPHAPVSNLLHSPEPEVEDLSMSQFPKARGLVRAS